MTEEHTYRVLVRDRGKALAARAVEDLGVDFRDLKASATDMNLIKVKRRR
jgi:hypothetical protein